MDTKTIAKIIDLMKESDLTEFRIEEEGLKLRIKRGLPSHLTTGMTTEVQLTPQLSTHPIHAQTSNSQPRNESKIHLIKSPMVGTFYKSSSPENPPFAKVNDKVEKNTIVCILEAMKIMNEIHAEVQGVILEVLAENGQTIEYGQPLFKVKLE